MIITGYVILGLLAWIILGLCVGPIIGAELRRQGVFRFHDKGES